MTEQPQELPAGRPEFARLVEEHWAAVFRMLRVLGGNTHLAEDLTQETFLRALRAYDRLQAFDRLRTWLLTIATHAYYDQVRRRNRLTIESLVEEPVAERSPSERLERDERAEKLRLALMELTELTRLVFHLRVREDLSFREIAELAGTTEASARWHMHHARTRMIERLGADF